MTHAQSLISPAQALLRVFSPNTPTSISRCISHRKARVSKPTSVQVRHATSMNPRSYASNNIKNATVDPFPDIVRDNAIMAQYVRIPTPDGGLSPAESLRSALSRLRRDTEHLVQISKLDDEGVVICRIMTAPELLKQKRDKERALKEQKKTLKQLVAKQIELNWGISSNDLEHKMTQLKGFIQDGKRVEIVLASKRWQRQATPEEGREVLRKVREKLAEAHGRETKAMQGGEVGKHTVLTARKKGLE